MNYGDNNTQSYTFDALGNRLTKTDNWTGNESYSVNAANMLLTRNTNNYVNDANGNTLSSGNRVNTWDSQNRLVRVVFGTGASQKTSDFTYGSDGLRSRMQVTNADGSQTT